MPLTKFEISWSVGAWRVRYLTVPNVQEDIWVHTRLKTRGRLSIFHCLLDPFTRQQRGTNTRGRGDIASLVSAAPQILLNIQQTRPIRNAIL